MQSLPEPTVMMRVGDKNHTFLIDTGAGLSLVNDKLGEMPKTPKTVQAVGVTGQVTTRPVSKPQRVTLGPVTASHAFILSSVSPSNLLGRDLLCTPDGIYLHEMMMHKLTWIQHVFLHIVMNIHCSFHRL